MNLSTTSPTTMIAIAAAVIAYLYLTRKETADDRKHQAIELAGLLKAEGFSTLPTILMHIATGDGTALRVAIKNLVDVFRNPATRLVELEAHFQKQLADRLADPTQCRLIASQVTAAQASVAPASGA